MLASLLLLATTVPYTASVGITRKETARAAPLQRVVVNSNGDTVGAFASDAQADGGDEKQVLARRQKSESDTVGRVQWDSSCGGQGTFSWWSWSCTCNDGYVNGGRFKCFATDACQTVDLETVVEIASFYSAEEAFNCWKMHFAKLGEDQVDANLTQLENAVGAYAGTMRWFNGNSLLRGVVNAAWDGIDFDGQGQGAITNNFPSSGAPDVGIVQYQPSCNSVFDDRFPAF